MTFISVTIHSVLKLNLSGSNVKIWVDQNEFLWFRLPSLWHCYDSPKVINTDRMVLKMQYTSVV